MACQVMQIWTLTGLVGAFLDLVIAYFLLSASFIVFFASKLLGFFGLSLPCPCNGQFTNPNHKYCLQRNLLDCPIDKVASVQLSVKNKFPFDSIFAPDLNFDPNTNPVRDKKDKKIDGFGELEGEGSCSWVSDAKKSENGGGFGALSTQGLKGKGFMNKRSRAGIRRRRRGGSDYGKASSVSSYDPIGADPHFGLESISSTNKERNEKIEARTTPVDFGLDDERETPKVMKLGFDGDEEKTQIFLEQALQEEQAARAALYLDLEKERNAAATAADEAMAMIMRLQQEKALVEMEANQYQRLIEEKSAYDEEEMNLLKEILLRKERETHYLEKEVEAYRQMGYSYTGNEQFYPSSLPDQSEDPVLMLQRLSESIDKKESMRNIRLDSALALRGKQMQNFSPPLGKELRIQGWDEQADISKWRDLEEQFSRVSKRIDDPYAQPEEGSRDLQSNKSRNSQEHNLLEKTIPIVGKESVKTRDVSTGKYASKGSKDSSDSKELRVLDVHVVDDDSKRVSRTSSDMTSGLPPTGSRGKSVISNMRRSSMSALDSERLKIETEVGWLRERLKTVQQGREKLNLSVDYNKEREKLQLQLLEDITQQLQEIRQLTEPGKTSLPPLSFKAMLSKKRRCRSASLGVQKSY